MIFVSKLELRSGRNLTIIKEIILISIQRMMKILEMLSDSLIFMTSRLAISRISAIEKNGDVQTL